MCITADGSDQDPVDRVDRPDDGTLEAAPDRRLLVSSLVLLVKHSLTHGAVVELELGAQ